MKKLGVLAVAALAIGVAVAPAGAGTRAATVGAKVKVVNFAFIPKTAKIEPGERVKWKGKEGSHTVTFRNGSFDKMISAGDTLSKRFKKPGTYKYFCRFHEAQGHKGKVVVR